MDIPEVILFMDLACRMAQECIAGILGIHATAIIFHTQCIYPTTGDIDNNPCTASIDGIFDKLLDNTHRSFHHFTSRNHIRNLCT